MKKIVVFISVMMCLLMIFSSFSVFAEDVGVIGSADGETDIIVGGEGEINEEEIEEYLMNSEFAPYLALIGFGIIFSMLGFLPSLIVMIVFITKNNKAKKELREYQLLYGPLENFSIQHNNYQANNPMNNPINNPVNNQNFNNGYNNTYPNGFNNNQGGQM